MELFASALLNCSKKLELKMNSIPKLLSNFTLNKAESLQSNLDCWILNALINYLKEVKRLETYRKLTLN